jgi:bifunctional N-acetylglucosamine-1-phosphate-uridyltransferase/glucosamine-1-phosphate-acetyltransferase GlmU-like protein|uniref:UDP-N-acetylglucosamine diphosphorylase n=1 Tax=viral metagenome TaxID=1070528 RepID=A0A6C0IL42_9ZZZZ
MYTIVLAGGLGKRMNSDIPKVLHKVNDIPMICLVIREAFKLNTENVLVVVGKYKDIIKKTIHGFFSNKECNKITYIVQEDKTINGTTKTMGTGDAVHCCIPYLQKIRNNGDEGIVILSGDVPLIKHTTINLLLTSQNALLTTLLRNPFGCGRIFANNESEIIKIVEEKDCNEEERQCKQVNCGIYNLNIDVLIECIPLITNNNKSQEYYLTDIVEIARSKQIPIHGVILPVNNGSEILNVNTPEDLEIANSRA